MYKLIPMVCSGGCEKKVKRSSLLKARNGQFSYNKNRNTYLLFFKVTVSVMDGRQVLTLLVADNDGGASYNFDCDSVLSYNSDNVELLQLSSSEKTSPVPQKALAR